MGLWSKFKSTWINGNLVFGVANGATTGDFIMNDNIKLTFGTGSDAKLFWNGSELQGPNPTSGMWANAPSLSYSDIGSYYMWTEDFMQLVIDNTTSDPLGWTVNTEDSGAIVMLTGSTGGVIHMDTGATDNGMCYMQIGTDAVGTTVEVTDSSGLEVWFECRVKNNWSTESAVFIGLTEEGNTDLIVDNGASLADKDLIGFCTFVDANDEWDFVFKKEPDLPRYTDANVVTNANDWHIFGFHFDGASALTPYIDGTAGTEVATTHTSFPSGEELSPVIVIKTGTGATKSMEVDWIRLVAQRST